jgi:fluoride exporter
MWKGILAIGLGGGIGALLRWWLGLTLNAYFPTIPPGTLAANLIGGYVVGVAVAFFATYSALAPEWRLFVITGFCGGLTTFSTFSAEVVTLMQQGRALWALGAAGAHLIGSIVMTFAGIGTVIWIRG